MQDISLTPSLLFLQSVNDLFHVSLDVRLPLAIRCVCAVLGFCHILMLDISLCSCSGDGTSLNLGAHQLAAHQNLLGSALSSDQLTPGHVWIWEGLGQVEVCSEEKPRHGLIVYSDLEYNL